MVVEPKTVQLVEPDKEPVHMFSSTSRKVQIPSLSSKMIV